ncbi:MAG: hypothetical protein AB7O44_18675 [Hyphomicrobiaceae bacterium]
MPTYHNQGDPVGRRHPINPKESPAPARGFGSLTVVLASVAVFATFYALTMFG